MKESHKLRIFVRGFETVGIERKDQIRKIFQKMDQ